nr:MAG TPA: hypothetical protein [Caudoviricetes sp.]
MRDFMFGVDFGVDSIRKIHHLKHRKGAPISFVNGL